MTEGKEIYLYTSYDSVGQLGSMMSIYYKSGTLLTQYARQKQNSIDYGQQFL